MWPLSEHVEHSLSRHIKTQETRKDMKRWLQALYFHIRLNEFGHMEMKWVEAGICVMPKAGLWARPMTAKV